MRLNGVWTALVTPFQADGRVDEGALKALVEEQCHHGVDGLVPMGTTGESPTLSHEEHSEIIRKVLEWTQGRLPIMAGTGSNSTTEAIMLTKRAQEKGANYSLQVTPYYNKPNQEGFYRHFMTLAEAVDIPLVLYNIPGRTGKNVEVATILRLAREGAIVGVKDACGDLSQSMDLLAQRPQGLAVLAGDDNLTFPLMALGAEGVVSVASNIVPDTMAKLCGLCSAGQWDQARQLHQELLPFFKSLFLDTNPIPVKAAMAMMGTLEEYYRLPLAPTTEAIKEQIRQELVRMELL